MTMRALTVVLLAFAIFLLLGVAWYSQRFDAMMPGSYSAISSGADGYQYQARPASETGS